MDSVSLIGIIFGSISTLVLIIKFYKDSVKEKVGEGSVDVKQNEELIRLKGYYHNLKIEMEGKISGLLNDLENLKRQVENTDSKTARELEKIEMKVDKIMQLMLEIVKK